MQLKRWTVVLLLCLLAVALLFLERASAPVPAPENGEPHRLHAAEPTATPEPPPMPTATPDPEAAAFARVAPSTAMTFAELVGDNGDYEEPAGYPAADTYRVTVDLFHQVVLVYGKDADGAYTVPVRYMLCSSGMDGRTPTGTFPLKRYRVRFGLFQNDGTYGQYWTLIRGRIYFHSTLYSERDANTYIGETYDLLGTPASHGCIRLTVPDARFIYYNLAYGTQIEIREGDPDDAETAAIRARLTLPERPKAHVTLLPGEIPDTDNWRIADVPQDVPYKKGSQKGQK